jgi:hypothetical protein
MFQVWLILDANYLKNKLSRVGGAAAYPVGAAAYAVGAAAYTVGAAAYTVGAAAYMHHCGNKANSVQLS